MLLSYHSFIISAHSMMDGNDNMSVLCPCTCRNSVSMSRLRRDPHFVQVKQTKKKAYTTQNVLWQRFCDFNTSIVDSLVFLDDAKRIFYILLPFTVDDAQQAAKVYFQGIRFFFFFHLFVEPSWRRVSQRIETFLHVYAMKLFLDTVTVSEASKLRR